MWTTADLTGLIAPESPDADDEGEAEDSWTRPEPRDTAHLSTSPPCAALLFSLALSLEPIPGSNNGAAIFRSSMVNPKSGGTSMVTAEAAASTIAAAGSSGLPATMWSQRKARYGVAP